VAGILAGGALLLCASLTLDPLVYRWFPDPPRAGMSPEFHELLRSAGYLPVWIFVALVLSLADSARIESEGVRALFRRGGALLATVLLAGAASEVVKMLVRRERPDAHAGTNVFRPLLVRPFETSNLSFPSGHATLAFAAACFLSFLVPRAAPVFLFLALGCAYTRLVVHSHFLSDVVAGAVLGFAAAWLVHRLASRNAREEQGR
jgi:membrane-associated phospholipid phosphatase